MNLEKDALISIARRQNGHLIKEAQLAARKSLRNEATTARKRLAEEMRNKRLQIADDLKAAIVQSDSDIVASFKTDSELQYDAGVLGLDVAVCDSLNA